ncbi:MAG: hypothetical protein WA901_11580 [Phormidesmis sp.]
MKDVELLVLKSFVYAVMRQKTLPDPLWEKIRSIAESLDTRVDELGDLAEASPLLAPDFDYAYSALTSSAAERGMGLSSVPPDHDDTGPAHEPSNIVSAPERYEFKEDRETLKTVTNRIDEANSQAVQQALSSKNPIQSLRRFLMPGS